MIPMKTETKTTERLRCPLRLAVLGISAVWIALYFLKRNDRAWMNAVCEAAVTPWHHFAGRIYDALPFSAMELYILLGIFAVLAFLAQLVIHFVKRPREHIRLARWAITLLSAASAVFGLFCLWWGVYYYSDSFCDRSGLVPAEVAVEDLQSVTAAFAGLANDTAMSVQRDENGLCAADRRDILDRSDTVYREAVKLFPCLDAPELHAKGVLCSRLMSYTNFTGVFCPFTAEANVNIDSPVCMLPATAAHELAHQRGVAAEDEANFVSILACLCSGDADYVYSAALTGYVYLGNALHRADYEAWLAVYQSLCPEVRADLNADSAYWKQFQTPVKEVSDKVYVSFLETYGETRGMASYGACVDLLVAYYKDRALA